MVLLPVRMLDGSELLSCLYIQVWHHALCRSVLTCPNMPKTCPNLSKQVTPCMLECVSLIGRSGKKCSPLIGWWHLPLIGRSNWFGVPSKWSCLTRRASVVDCTRREQHVWSSAACYGRFWRWRVESALAPWTNLTKFLTCENEHFNNDILLCSGMSSVSSNEYMSH